MINQVEIKRSRRGGGRYTAAVKYFNERRIVRRRIEFSLKFVIKWDIFDFIPTQIICSIHSIVPILFKIIGDVSLYSDFYYDCWRTIQEGCLKLPTNSSWCLEQKYKRMTCLLLLLLYISPQKSKRKIRWWTASYSFMFTVLFTFQLSPLTPCCLSRKCAAVKICLPNFEL